MSFLLVLFLETSQPTADLKQTLSLRGSAAEPLLMSGSPEDESQLFHIQTSNDFLVMLFLKVRYVKCRI